MTSGAVLELLEVWRPQGVRLIVLDLRCAGGAERVDGGYTLERHAEDVLAVLDAEAVERAVLIGHSMGGQVAQLVAATRPDRISGLCLVLPVPASGLSLPADARAMFRAAGGNAEALGRILDMASPGLPGGVRGRLLAEALRIAPRCVAEAFDAWSAGGFADRLASIRAPTLVVASDDPFLPVALLREQVAGMHRRRAPRRYRRRRSLRAERTTAGARRRARRLSRGCAGMMQAVSQQQVKERLRSYRQLLTRLVQSDALSTGDIDAAYRQVTELAVQLLNVERTSVWRLDGMNRQIECVDLYEQTPRRHSERDGDPGAGRAAVLPRARRGADHRRRTTPTPTRARASSPRAISSRSASARCSTRPSASAAA